MSVTMSFERPRRNPEGPPDRGTGRLPEDARDEVASGEAAPPVGVGIDLLERERELDALGRLLDTAALGRAATVFIEAAAGLGKTALLRCTRERATQLGFRAFDAVADEPERHIPFETMRALLDRLVDDDEQDVFEGPAAACRAVLAGEHVHRELDGHALQHAFLLVLRRLASRCPVLLLVDDAHWADPASLSVVATLVRRVGACPLLVAIAARPNEADSDDAVLSKIAADPDTHLLRPKPLSLQAAGVLVRRDLDPAADDSLCAACHDVTAGNPFLLRQLLRELADEAVDIGSLGREDVQRLGPRSISRSVLVRLSRLGPEAVNVCRAAAVLGEHGSLHTVAALAGVSPERAATAADALGQVAVFRRALGFSFVHPIIRSAVVADLAPHERAALHAEAVRILRAAGSTAGALAAHLLEVEPAADDDVVRTLLDAASEALRQGVPADAVAYLRRALDEPPSEDLRPAVLEELGRAELHRDPTAALELLEQAAALRGDAGEQLHVRRTEAEALIALGRTREAVRMLGDIAEAAAHTGDTDLTALCTAQVATVARADLETRDLSHQAGARLAHAAPECPLALVLHCANAAIEEGVRGAHLGRTTDLAETALRDGRLLREGDARLACELAFVLASADRSAQAEAVLEAVCARASSEADVRARVLAIALLGHVALRRGDLTAASDHAHEALTAASTIGWRPGVAHALATLVEVLVERSALDEAEALLSEHGLQHALPAARASTLLYASRARLRFQGGDPDAARRDAEESLTLLAVWGAENPAFSTAREWQVRALEALDDRTAAQAAAAEQLARAEAWGAASAHARALRVAARLARGEEAIALLRRAVERAMPSPDALEAAREQLELGAALRRAGRRAEGRESLTQALALADACGAAVVAEQARAELASLGVRRHRDEVADRSTLTASEMRVAELVAEGLSNREISERLFVTLKTVEAHLTSTYRKLGIRSRTELVRWLTVGKH